MAKAGTIKWIGQSDRKYEYDIHTLDTTHKAVPANYVFAKQTEPNTYNPIYAGETGDISERFDNHHKMPCIIREGATHICTHTSSSDDKVRKAEESDIIERWHPPCND